MINRPPFDLIFSSCLFLLFLFPRSLFGVDFDFLRCLFVVGTFTSQLGLGGGTPAAGTGKKASRLITVND